MLRASHHPFPVVNTLFQNRRFPNELPVDVDIADEFIPAESVITSNELEVLEYECISVTSGCESRVFMEVTWPATLAIYPDTVASPSASCLYTGNICPPQTTLTESPRCESVISFHETATSQSEKWGWIENNERARRRAELQCF